MTKTRKKLFQEATKLSEIMKLANEDMRLVLEDSKNYKINMDVWHQPNSKCSVCYAGSVMAKSFKCNPSKDIDIHNSGVFTVGERDKFRALDYIRGRGLRSALSYINASYLQIALEYEFYEKFDRVDWLFECEDKKECKEFIAQMEKVAEWLESKGL